MGAGYTRFDSPGARPRSEVMSETWDYIVVGAGSAGSIVASRLSESPDKRVLLLEAGGSDRRWQIRIPAAVRENVKASSRVNWHFESEPEPGLDHRRIAHPRGKVLGGSGSINGMVFLRGHPLDYERWSQEGARGWSYRNVLPYFKRLENNENGADRYRSVGGPIRVRRQQDLWALSEAFLDAGPALGYPATDDFNGYRQDGFGRFDMNVDRGVRASSAYAILRPAMRRANLRILTHCHARRILFEGERAAGIEYRRRGRIEEARCERELVLCGGAFGSPQLLMLSGIGPAEQLTRREIPVRVDLPGVGRNLQDHLEVHLQHECPDPVSVNLYMHPLRKLAIGLRWLLTRSGPAASGQSHVGAFLKLRPESAHPDAQIHFWAAIFDGWEVPHDRFGFRLGIGPMRPTSRGEVRLRSADPEDPPLLHFNYCATEEDRRDMRECVHVARRIAGSPAFSGFRSKEIDPGPEIRSDEEIDAWVRRTATTSWHPSGTCAMGDPAAAHSVVDPETRVKGVAGLRIVDASIMPSIASSNLNAVVMMMAERASDLIRGRPLLPPEDAEYYIEGAV